MEQGIVLKKVLYVLRLPVLNVSAWLKMLITWGIYPFFSKKNAFFCAHFTTLGLLAKVDGNLTQEELTYFNNYISTKLNLNEKKIELAKKLFLQPYNQKGSFTFYISRLATLCKGNIEVLVPFFDTLNELAMVDGPLTQGEKEILLYTLNRFGIHQYQSNNGRDPYKVLGAKIAYTNEQLKKCYRKKINDFHPDKLATLGLPAEFMGFSIARFQEIQQAYEVLRHHRGF